jgi:hypothetical protein
MNRGPNCDGQRHESRTGVNFVSFLGEIFGVSFFSGGMNKKGSILDNIAI